MPDPERGTTKVSQSAIKEIQQLGMSKAIAKYTAGDGSAEFRTAVERYYSPKRLKDASSASNPKSTPTEAPKTPTPVKMPESATAAAQRRTEKTTAEKVLGKSNAEAVSKATKPISNAANAIASQRAVNADTVGKTVSSISKKLGLHNPFKPRKRG